MVNSTQSAKNYREAIPLLERSGRVVSRLKAIVQLRKEWALGAVCLLRHPCVEAWECAVCLRAGHQSR
jgi:predicted amino acid racemase